MATMNRYSKFNNMETQFNASLTIEKVGLMLYTQNRDKRKTRMLHESV